MQELTILADISPLAADNVRILWRDSFPKMSSAARSHINARWDHYQQQAVSAGTSLFNAEITCLAGAHFTGGILTLDLAPADYKDFLVTVLRDRAWFLRNDPAARRPALGNSALLTHQGHALLGVRSHRVSAYAGRAHLIGGVLERFPTATPSAANVVEHLTRELAEEAAIVPIELAEPPKLLALVRDEWLGQPELIWQCELTVPVENIAPRLTAEEHTACEVVTQSPIPAGLWQSMTPVARCAWRRWQTFFPQS